MGRQMNNYNYFCYDCEGYHALSPTACHYHRRYWKY